MAEGFANALRSSDFVASSAGLNPKALNPYAKIVMLEAGIDIQHHTTTDISDVASETFDVVYVLCCEGQRTVLQMFKGCGTAVECVNICSPKRAVQAAEKEEMSDEERLVYYRAVRDEIRSWVMAIC